MNTTENNKLIAEFMGYNLEIVNDEIYFTLDDMLEALSDEELHYHTDWNWLMEVVEKIKEFFNGTDPLSDKQISEVIKLRKKLNESFTSVDVKIEYVYNTCVEFIKWYNEQK